MTDEYDALITEYRAELPTKTRLIDAAAYVLGFTLLIAPFIRALAVPLAVLSLSYFAFVFISLAVWDLTASLRRTLTQVMLQLLAQLHQATEVGLTAWRFYLDAWERIRKNLLAFASARALWDRLFFSLRVARPKVFFNSVE